MIFLLVYGWSLACGCLGGVGMACEVSYGSIFQWCVTSACADTIHNIKQSCTLVAHDISSAFPVLSGGAYIRKRQLASRVIK
jgi:hypothetical protein